MKPHPTPSCLDAPNTIGSGYIRMNANPSDPTTPYMDIVERTGSGIYDVELKAQKERGLTRKLVGLELIEKGIAIYLYT